MVSCTQLNHLSHVKFAVLLVQPFFMFAFLDSRILLSLGCATPFNQHAITEGCLYNSSPDHFRTEPPIRRGTPPTPPIVPQVGYVKFFSLTYNLNPECEGWDSNPRTPAGVDLKSTAFGRAWLPSHKNAYCYWQRNLVNYPALKGGASCFMDNTCITEM